MMTYDLVLIVYSVGIILLVFVFSPTRTPFWMLITWPLLPFLWLWIFRRMTEAARARNGHDR